MEDNYKFAALMPWIAAVTAFPRNDGGGANNRHCEECVSTTRQSRAFSLIELLISLIIISLIVSSFIPILTKKIKHHNATLAAGVMNCKKFDEKCMLCDKKECTLCTTQINLIDGQYVDPKTSCEVKQCPNNCAKCDGTICMQCKEDYSLNDGKCIKGACIKVGNICVQRFNAGDKGGLEIPANLVELMSAANGGYSGCDRTVCTWNAAYKICAHYGLRLPSQSEAAMFAIHSLSKGEDGLQLCDKGQNPQSSKCASAKRCSLEHSGKCMPNRIWCLRKDGKTAAQSKSWRPNGWRGGGMVYYLQDSQWYLFRNLDGNGEEECNSYSASVRCVRDL